MKRYILTKAHCENFWLGRNGHLCLRWSVIRLCLKRKVAACFTNTFESGTLFIKSVSLDVPDPRRCWWIIRLAFNNARLYFRSCTLLHFSANSSRFVQFLYLNTRAAYVDSWRCPVMSVRISLGTRGVYFMIIISLLVAVADEHSNGFDLELLWNCWLLRGTNHIVLS